MKSRVVLIAILLLGFVVLGRSIADTSSDLSAGQQASCPDLVPRGFTLFGPQIIHAGESLKDRLVAFVRNVGTDSCTSSNIGFYMSADTIITTGDQLLTGGREAVNSIEPGFIQPVSTLGSMTLPVGWGTRPGYLGVIVDEQSHISECNEGNNTAWIHVTVTDALPATRHVPAEYATIAEAIAAANAGDTIKIDAGTFDEDFSVSKDLVFCGAGPDATIIKTTDNDVAIIIVTNASVVFSNLQLYSNVGGPDFVSTGIDAVGSTIAVRNCKLYRIPNFSINAIGCNLLIDSTQIIQLMGEADVGVYADSCTFTIRNSYGGPFIDHVFDPCGPSLGLIEGNVIDGSSVYWANGVRIRDFTAAVVRNNTIIGQHDTTTGPSTTVGGIVVFGQSNVDMYDNIVQKFSYGLSASSGAALRVHGNALTDNVRAGVNLFANPHVDLGGGAYHSPGCNDIYNNGPYNIQVGNATTVYAKNNDWNLADSALVDATQYDNEEDAALGDVLFTPFGYCIPTGLHIVVYMYHGVYVIFDQITQSGLTSLVTYESGPRPPLGYRLISPRPDVYFDISTSAIYSGKIQVCFPYDKLSLHGRESRLRLFHRDGTLWTDITSSLDTVTHTICGVTSSLSPFILAEPSKCCEGTTGNVDGDAEDLIDISDLSAMVDYLFMAGEISRCPQENDVDKSGSVDISDLSGLVDYLFFGGALPACP